MTVADLIEIKEITWFIGKEKMLKNDLIALDAKDGKRLFDTRKNKKEYIEQFMSGKVVSLWADVVLEKGYGYSDYFKPVMKCYVSHDSWKTGDKA